MFEVKGGNGTVRFQILWYVPERCKECTFGDQEALYTVGGAAQLLVGLHESVSGFSPELPLDHFRYGVWEPFSLENYPCLFWRWGPIFSLARFYLIDICIVLTGGLGCSDGVSGPSRTVAYFAVPFSQWRFSQRRVAMWHLPQRRVAQRCLTQRQRSHGPLGQMDPVQMYGLRLHIDGFHQPAGPHWCGFMPPLGSSLDGCPFLEVLTQRAVSSVVDLVTLCLVG